MSTRELRQVDDETTLEHCRGLMAELRPQCDDLQTFAAAWKQQREEGYRLIALFDGGEPLALAGYRVQHNLMHGRFLYVDDLVTTAARRGEGLGEHLLAWLKDEARRQGCGKLLLDTPLGNVLGHRFYYRHGLFAGALRFNIALDAD
jgi:GNAT superfamily N-acetyltransferase